MLGAMHIEFIRPLVLFVALTLPLVACGDGSRGTDSNADEADGCNRANSIARATQVNVSVASSASRGCA